MDDLAELKAFAALVDLAMDQHTLVTMEDAESVEVPPEHLRRWTAAGLLTSRIPGIYRVEALAGDRREQLQAALLWAGADAVLVGGTALDLHDLSDLVPHEVEVAIPRGVSLRPDVPPTTRVHRRHVPESSRTRVEGLAVESIPLTILDAVESGLGDRFVEEALETARQRGQLTPEDEQEIEELRRVRYEVALARMKERESG